MLREGRPFIGLTTDSADKPGRFQLNGDYVKAVEAAGGVAIPLPFMMNRQLLPELLDALDGVLFTGGGDIDPSLYGESWHPQAVRLDAARQDFELTLLAELEKRRMPVLGVCLGCQMLNVYRGGSLHQFLPDLPRPNPIEHRRLDRDLPTHAVSIDPESIIGRAIGRAHLTVNTYHQQAVKTTGRNLRVVATAPDGIVEAIEDPSLPLFAAVQWHPERLTDVPEHLAIFRLLTDAARCYRREKSATRATAGAATA